MPKASVPAVTVVVPVIVLAPLSVVVPVPFYLQVVQRVLGAGGSVVYVMPEVKPLRSAFSNL